MYVPDLDEMYRLTTTGTCTECKKTVEGWVAVNSFVQIINCGGFVLHSTGIICDACRYLACAEEVHQTDPEDIGMLNAAEHMLEAHREQIKSIVGYALDNLYHPLIAGKSKSG